jgi:predicted porin
LGTNAKIDINGEVGARYNINQTMSLHVKYARDQVSGERQGLNQSIYGAGLGVSW